MKSHENETVLTFCCSSPILYARRESMMALLLKKTFGSLALVKIINGNIWTDTAINIMKGNKNFSGPHRVPNIYLNKLL